MFVVCRQAGVVQDGVFCLPSVAAAVAWGEGRNGSRREPVKIVVRVVAAVVVSCALALVVLRFTGLDPQDRRPGLWIKGAVETALVNDWSFTNDARVVVLETRAWYGLPHSVNIGCSSVDGRLYVSSVYPEPTIRPWIGNLLRDPHVRLRIGEKVYELTVAEVTDPAEKTAVLAAREKKYGQKPPDDLAQAHIFRVVGQGPA